LRFKHGLYFWVNLFMANLFSGSGGYSRLLISLHCLLKAYSRIKSTPFLQLKVWHSLSPWWGSKGTKLHYEDLIGLPESSFFIKTMAYYSGVYLNKIIGLHTSQAFWCGKIKTVVFVPFFRINSVESPSSGSPNGNTALNNFHHLPIILFAPAVLSFDLSIAFNN